MAATILLVVGASLSATASGNPGALRYAPLHVLPRDAGYVNGMACAPDGSLLAIAGDDGRIALWSIASGSLVRVLRGHKGAAYSVAFSPDGATIASGGLDETIRIWDPSSGRERRLLAGHKGWINAVAFTPDGKQLLSAGRDRTVRVWDIETGKLLRVIEYPSEVFTVAAGPNGRLFASDKENSFSIREIATANEIASGVPGQWGINTVVFSPARPELMSSGYDGVLWVWDIRGAKLDRHIQIEGSPIVSLATTADGSILGALCSGNRTVVLFDTSTWMELGRLEGVTYPVGSLVFSADGRILAVGGGDSPVRIWERSDPR